MKVKYKGFTIDCYRYTSLSGCQHLYYSVFNYETELELVSGFTDSDVTVVGMINFLKMKVDDYLENQG